MVEANRGWLSRLLAGVFAMLGFGDGVTRRVGGRCWRMVRALEADRALAVCHDLALYCRATVEAERYGV